MHLLQLIQLLGLTARSPVMLDARQAVEFSNYNGCAQDCLQNNAENTNCLSYSTVKEQSACICVDSSFITASAQCIYTSCAYAIFELSASTIISNYDSPASQPIPQRRQWDRYCNPRQYRDPLCQPRQLPHRHLKIHRVQL